MFIHKKQEQLFATSLFTIHKVHSSSFLTSYHIGLNLMVVTYVCMYVLSRVWFFEDPTDYM